MSIFVSVAAYLEPELEQTIQSAIDNSSDPEALHFGVFEQSKEPVELQSSTAKITKRWIHHSEALGAGYARAQVQKMYNNEDYFLQVDAHSLFTKDWDKRLVQWLDLLPEKSVVSGWPIPYSYHKGEIVLGRHEKNLWSVNEPHWCKIRKYGRSWIGQRQPLNDEQYRWSEIGLGGMWFCKGEFLNEVPYDPRIAWHGEEFMLTIRAFDAGWEIYGVNDTIIYHNYERHGNPRLWDEDKSWDDKQRLSIGIQSDLILFKDLSEYRMRNPHRLQEYMERTGMKDLEMKVANTAIRVGARGK